MVAPSPNKSNSKNCNHSNNSNMSNIHKKKAVIVRIIVS